MPRDPELIGVVDDDPVMGGTVTHRLELEGYRAVWWRTGQEAVAGLRRVSPDLVVCDIRLPDMTGEEVFEVASQRDRTPFLFITAYGQIDQAVRLTKAGAADYIAKPFALPDLLERIARLVGARSATTGALGTSEAMREVEAMLRRVADIDSTVLITGESGAGKEVAARFVHETSKRAHAPFMAVNCAAIPGELIESELFGHEKGAFTGAHARHHGYVERSRNGILFLDEVGDLPVAAQAKLLRLVEERAFTLVGGETRMKSSARIVCATNTDLGAAVADGRFRADLYYRLNVISVVIPPLRGRPEDVLPLAHRFTREFAETFGREVHGFSQSAEQALLRHLWPGNVRELRNRIERSVALGQGPWLGVGDLFPERGGDGRPEQEVASLAEAREDAERRHILAVLERTGGRLAKSAALLGISRTTLWEKVRRLGITFEHMD
jgi:DNA-binding NtrC family response regulator